MNNEEILRDIVKCTDCYWGRSCSEENICNQFAYLQEEDFENKVLPALRERIRPSEDRKLKRHSVRSNDVSYDGDSLDSYYVGMINDTLSEIRDGHTAYIFNLEQVCDVLRFEPDADFTLHDGTYYVNLPLERLRSIKESKGRYNKKAYILSSVED
jgi:hypothetical protein